MLPQLFMATAISFLQGLGYLIMEYPPLDIRTVALTLGRICRFAGNCKTFWPVLLHSLVVAHLVPEQFAIHALLRLFSFLSSSKCGVRKMGYRLIYAIIGSVGYLKRKQGLRLLVFQSAS